MAIAIDGTGSITGISAGGLPDGTVDTDVLAANAVTEAKLGSDEQKGLAKAWVDFNGSGTVAIRSSFNVSSISDNGTGLFGINFTNAMANANYFVVGSGSNSYGDVLTSSNYNRICETRPFNTTSCSVACYAPDNGVLVDIAYAGIAVFAS